MIPSDVTNNMRCAGNVIRYHTWPTIQNQTNADHTFHVLRIYTELFGPPRPDVMLHILYHDMSEIRTGDMPFPVKQIYPELKQGHDKAAYDWFRENGVSGHSASLTVEEAQAFKIADELEMIEYAMYEMHLGNDYMLPVVDRLVDSINKRLIVPGCKLNKKHRTAVAEWMTRIFK